jgi:hypothetical protein
LSGQFGICLLNDKEVTLQDHGLEVSAFFSKEKDDPAYMARRKRLPSMANNLRSEGYDPARSWS